MNKKIAVMLLFGAVILNLLTGVLYCESKLNIWIDPRMELLAVVQLLSGYGEKNNLLIDFNYPYKEDVLSYFAPYKDHPAVKLFKEMSERFNCDAPPTAMLYLSNPPQLNIEKPFTEYILQRAGGKEQLEKFIGTLRDFAKETQFMVFFNSHKGMFSHIEAQTRKELEGTDYIGEIEKYYGMKHHSYNMILFLLSGHSYGPSIERPDNSMDIYSIAGPRYCKDGYPIFGNKEGMRYLLQHELGHSFVNPLTEHFSKEIGRYESLLKPIYEKMRKIAYGNWKTTVNEHLLRAISIHQALKAEGKDAAEEATQIEELSGFFYIRSLVKALELYDVHRDKYPTFKEFYPEVIDVFKKLSKAKLGKEFYTFPYNGLFQSIGTDGRKKMYVVPTNEEDKEIQKTIHKYVTYIRDSDNKDCPIITDEEALKNEYPGYYLVIYGTPNGNLWLKKYLHLLPVTCEPGKITIEGKTYTGEHLRFLTTCPYPSDFKRGVMIYSAPKAEDVILTNSVPQMYWDYVISAGNFKNPGEFKVLAHGKYKHIEGVK